MLHALIAIVALSAGLPDDPPPSVELLRAEVRELIEKGELDDAKDRLKAFKKAGKGSVSKEVRHFEKWIKGRKAVASLRAKQARKKLTPIQILQQLPALDRKYQSVPEVKKEILKYWGELTLETYLILHDFERPYPDQYGTAIIDHPVRRGKGAMHWKDSSAGEGKIDLHAGQGDWSGEEALIIWVFAEKPGQIFELRLWTQGGGAHLAHVKVRWTGWKEVRLPLHGKKSPFRTDPGTDWTKLTSIQFFKEEGLKIDLVIDDILLEKSFRPEPKRRKK